MSRNHEQSEQDASQSASKEEQDKSIPSWLWWISAILTFAGAGIMHGFGKEYISPFIQFPQDTISPLETWARSCLESKANIYFFGDFLFALGVCVLSCLLYCFFTKQKGRLRIYLFFFLAFGFDLAETWTYYSDDLSIAFNIQQCRAAAYGLSMIILTYFGIKRLVWFYNAQRELIRTFFKNYFTYFYPSILSIIVLVILFRSLDQFNTIILELTEPWTLAFFSILFMSTIVKVWYMPSYAQFTDGFYGILRQKDYDKSEDKDSGNLYIRKNNFKGVLSSYGLFLPMYFLLDKEAEEESKKNLGKEKEEKGYGIIRFMLAKIRYVYFRLTKKAKEDNKSNSGDSREDESTQTEINFEKHRIIRSMLAKVRPIRSAGQPSDDSQKWGNEQRANELFHTVRRWLGLSFIAVFFYLQSNAAQAMDLFPFPPMIASLIFLIIFLSLLSYAERKVKDEDSRRKCFYLFFFCLVVFAGLLLLTGANNFFGNEIRAMKFFMAATIASGFAFCFLTVFRYPKEKVENMTKASVNLDRQALWLTTFLQFLNTFIVPAVAFTVFLLCLLPFSWTCLHSVNPTNFYLLFVTGLISIFALIDRAVKLHFMNRAYEKLKKLKEEKNKDIEEEAQKLIKEDYALLLARLITVLLVITMFSLSENYHHEVNYLKNRKSDTKDSIMTMKDYTEKFLNERSGSDTIFLIAAEGGGLRAAYWTMLALNGLGEDVYENTFLMSGASGGGIGQGLFNYMYYENVDSLQRDRIMNALAATNFLTTDFAGILTRSAVTKIAPPLECTKHYKDRHYLMQQGYWDVMARYDNRLNWKAASSMTYYKPWQKTSRHLPVYISNTTRTENGSRAVVHPFQADEKIFEPYLNITTNYDGNVISYPEAVFLTNRFPVASPAARAEGRGRFVDGGYFENTGLKTILHTLLKMKSLASAGQDSVYQEFFDCEIVLISIRNSQEAYLNEALVPFITADSVNRSLKSGELGSVIKAAAGSGMTGLSNYYADLFKDDNVKEHFGIDSSGFHNITLPYRIKKETPHKLLFQGQIATKECALNDTININNDRLQKFYASKKPQDQSMNILMPPLNRMMNKNTVDYMKIMLEYDGVMPSF